MMLSVPSCLDFYSRLENDQVIWFQETLQKLLLKWSTNNRVIIGIFRIETFRKVEFVRNLIIKNQVAVRQHIFLSNHICSTSLRGGFAKVTKLVLALQLTFDLGGVLIGLEKKRKL